MIKLEPLERKESFDKQIFCTNDSNRNKGRYLNNKYGMRLADENIL